MDQSDEYVMTELEDDADLEDGGDTEPSLGSFDRMVNQEKSYRQVSFFAFPSPDLEEDDCDREDDDPKELDDTGIGDLDGLLEQISRQDWQAGRVR